MSFVKVLCRECGVLEKDERNIRDIDILERYCIQQRGDSERDGFCRNGFCVEDMVYNGKVIFLVRFAVQRDGVCKEIQRERDIYTVYKDIQKDTVYRERALERELWRERERALERERGLQRESSTRESSREGALERELQRERSRERESSRREL